MAGRVFEAHLFDRASSRRVPVSVAVGDDGRARVVDSGGATLAELPWSELNVSDRIGSVVRSLRLPDGRLLETGDNDAVDAIERRLRQGAGARVVHAVERRWKTAMVAIAVAVAAIWLWMAYGIPLAADVAARLVPSSTEAELGDLVFEQVDGTLFGPSSLPSARKADLESVFRRVVPESGIAASGARLVFRDGGGFGANALALPGGTIIVTDALVRLADDNVAKPDAALAGVFAHEFGHVVEHHGLRRLLRAAAFSGMILLVTGTADVSELALGAAATLVEARHSRAFEREADAHALAALARAGIGSAPLADLFETMGKSRAGGGWLDTHPATGDRARMMRPD